MSISYVQQLPLLNFRFNSPNETSVFVFSSPCLLLSQMALLEEGEVVVEEDIDDEEDGDGRQYLCFVPLLLLFLSSI
uniref:Ovule protein n=1 Tax=Caenorhabditis tropicalis TaxID=1561998 RepID=A0A1I7U5Y9_9PELO